MKISVVVPVYNVKPHLKECVDSLLAQTFSDREIILVDDGSTDGSDAVCDGYGGLPGVQVIHQANAGLGMARNRGLEAARGAYVAFVDSDDALEPDSLENLYGAGAPIGADVVIGGYTMIDSEGRRERRPCTEVNRLFFGSGLRELTLNTVGSLPEEKLDSRYGLSAWGRLYRREVIEARKIRFVSERELISEDLIFNLDVLRHARRAMVTSGCGYLYRYHPGSLSRGHRPDRFAQDCKLFQAVQARLEEGGIPPKEYALYLHRMLISRARFDLMQEVAHRDEVERDYPLRKAVEDILAREELQRALKDYPWQRLPRTHGIFAFAMKRGWTDVLIWLIRGRRLLQA